MMRLASACLALLLVFSTVARAGEPDNKSTAKQNLCLQDEKCRNHYAAANELYRASKLLDAVKEYKAAYAEVQLPVFLYNLGRLHHRLGNLTKAAEYYRTFLSAAVDEDPGQQARAKEYLTQIQQSDSSVAPVTQATSAPSVFSQPADTAQSKKTPIYKKWWLWTIVGGVVVGTTIGLAISLAPKPQPGLPDGIQVIMMTF